MLGELLSLSAAFLWAIGAGMYRIGLRRAHPIGLNFLRSIPAATFLFMVNVLTGDVGEFFIMDGRVLAYVLAASLVGWAVGDSLYFIGLKFIGVSRTVALSYSYPLFIIPLSFWFLNESLSYRTIIGSLAIVSSIWLVSRSLSRDDVGSGRNWIGVISGISAAICWAIGIVAFKHIMFSLDPIFLALLRLLVIIPVLGAVSAAPQIRKTLSKLSWRELAISLAGGTIALGLGDLVYFMGLNLTNASIAGALAATTPIFSGLIAVIFLRERANWRIVAGLISVTIGAVLLST